MMTTFKSSINLDSLEKTNCDAVFPLKNLYVNDNQYEIVSSC